MPFFAGIVSLIFMIYLSNFRFDHSYFYLSLPEPYLFNHKNPCTCTSTNRSPVFKVRTIQNSGNKFEINVHVREASSETYSYFLFELTQLLKKCHFCLFSKIFSSNKKIAFFNFIFCIVMKTKSFTKQKIDKILNFLKTNILECLLI